MATTQQPIIQALVDQRYLLEPLGGPQDPRSYLDRFPEEIYTKTLDTRLVKFMYAMLGPVGIGWLKQNYLEARLLVEENNIDLYDLDRFFGNPFGFGRSLEEVYDQDPQGLISSAAFDQIRQKDASYRNRSLTFFLGARMGNTPEGMRFAAKAALGHETEVVENYKYLYDQHTDKLLNLDYHGKTLLAEEFVVLPRRELSRTETQSVTVSGDPSVGTLSLSFMGQESFPIDRWATAQQVKDKLAELPAIGGADNIEVSGDPGGPWTVSFVGDLSHVDTPQLEVASSFLDGDRPLTTVTTEIAGYQSWDETVTLSPRQAKDLQVALDRFRPMHTIPTYQPASGTRSQTLWKNVAASSEYREIIRYVTGRPDVPWPTPDPVNVIPPIIPGQETELPPIQPQPPGFHDVPICHDYGDDGCQDPDYGETIWCKVKWMEHRSIHVGRFHVNEITKITYLGQFTDDTMVFESVKAIAKHHEPPLLSVKSNTKVTQTYKQVKSKTMIHGVYPVEYQNLPNVQTPHIEENFFWASKEQVSGSEFLEIDFGTIHGVNLIEFEIINKPIRIYFVYDKLSIKCRRRWHRCKPWDFHRGPHHNWGHHENSYDISVIPDVEIHPEPIQIWEHVSFRFTNYKRQMIHTQFIRIEFERPTTQWNFIEKTREYFPYGVQIRNLRIGRNVTV